MGTNQELQQEELEVLRSIYDGDDRFKEISPIVFQYKIGEDADTKSFLLEVSWGENYPAELPLINLDTFYNKQLAQSLKSFIAQTLTEQAESMVGMAMTYTLFEYAKENADEMFANQPPVETTQPTQREDKPDPAAGSEPQAAKVKGERKEQLTKAQKRKLVSRLDVNGEMPRGWNWVDVVKHLCQTGRGPETDAT